MQKNLIIIFILAGAFFTFIALAISSAKKYKISYLMSFIEYQMSSDLG